MSNLVIKGMELPKTEKDSFLVIVRPNGVIYHHDECEYERYEAVELQSHGRLIDADKLKSKIIRERDGKGLMSLQATKKYNFALDKIFDAPTVLEASK